MDEKRWVDTWRRAGEALQRIEAETPLDVEQSLLQLMPVFALARQAEPVTTTSGLVEMQRWFRKLHHG